MTTRWRACVRASSLALSLAILAPAGTSSAGGFYVNEFATSAMGTAGAGAGARADDASTALHNPAGMTRLEEHQLALGFAPGYANIEFDPDPSTPVPGSDGGNQGGFIPTLSAQYVHVLSDRWRAGLSLLSISGSVLNPHDDWVGRSEIRDLSLLTLSAAPSLAYRVNDWLSLGAGPLITYGRLDYDLALPAPLTGEVELDGLDDFAAAFAGTALVEISPRLRVGLAYVSESELHLSGDVNLPVGASAGIDLDLPLAQTARASLYWEATDRLTLLLSTAWEDWSTAANLPVSVSAGSAQVPLHFNDTWKGSIGLHYRLTDDWTLQTGFTYDTSPLDDGERTTAFPIDRQIRIAVGALHDLNEDMQIGVSFVWVDLGRAKVRSGATSPLTGVIGDYKSNDVFFLGMNVNWKKLPWSDR